MPTNDISALNKTYGAPGRIAFREGPAGHPVLSLTENRGTCEIALYGGHVLAYRPLGQSPVLWMSKSLPKVTPGQPIRGGIPICWPWFGAHPDNDKLPGHGFARLRRWRLMGTEYDSHQTRAHLQLTHDAESLAMWPYHFRLDLNVSVSDTLTVELTTTNKSDVPFTISQALHTYLLVREIADIRVLGLENIAYRDVSPAAKDDRQHGAIIIRDETDRLYRKTDGECTLLDPGIGRKIVVAKRGSHSTVVWNPWIDKAKRLPDMADSDYHRFICIETVNADSDAVVIEPNAEHLMSATIQSTLT